LPRSAAKVLQFASPLVWRVLDSEIIRLLVHAAIVAFRPTNDPKETSGNAANIIAIADDAIWAALTSDDIHALIATLVRSPYAVATGVQRSSPLF
jgi:hypothetical protein